MPIPPPIALPGAFPLAFDAVTLVWSFTAIVMLAALALLLWALRARDTVTYRLRCPTHGTEATVVVRFPRGSGDVDVTQCSLCDPKRVVHCEKRCLRLVA